MRAIGRQGAALAAESPGAHRNNPDRYISLCRARPNQSNDPADDRPAEQQVDNENAHGVGLVPPDERRQEIQQHRENQEEHFRTSLALIRPKASAPTPAQKTIRSGKPICSRRFASALANIRSLPQAPCTLASSSTNF